MVQINAFSAGSPLALNFGRSELSLSVSVTLNRDKEEAALNKQGDICRLKEVRQAFDFIEHPQDFFCFFLIILFYLAVTRLRFVNHCSREIIEEKLISYITFFIYYRRLKILLNMLN